MQALCQPPSTFIRNLPLSQKRNPSARASPLPLLVASNPKATQEIPLMPTNKPEQKIDRNAPAGTQNSLGEESIRDGRPSTDDSVEEAIDEEGPGISPTDNG
jgi:hypothetical protein